MELPYLRGMGGLSEMKRFFITCLVLISAAAVHAENINQAWEVAWSRFYPPKVQTFGDYLSSYEKGREQTHLPTAAEVRR